MVKRKLEIENEGVASNRDIRKSRRLENALQNKSINVKLEILKKNNFSVSKSDKENLNCKKENKSIKIPQKENKSIKISKKENKSIEIPKKENKSINISKKENKSIKIPRKEYKPIRNNFLIPVDKECERKAETASVFVEGRDIYDVMLNQTNLQYNNNKFYIIQLLKDKDKESYSVWMRWARVGKVGQNKLTYFGTDIVAAKMCFTKKFFDKTKNDWSNRPQFEKYDGKYDMIHIDYKTKENKDQVKEESKVKLEILDCKLDNKIQDLLKMIFDIKEMNSLATSMNYDNNKLPLGRLTEEQITAGFKALREIEGLINEGYKSNNKLLIACNAYYTRIPHDFGMRAPPMIRSIIEIKNELELLETLSDIKIALNLIEMGDINIHPLDRQYQSLECDIRPIKTEEKIYEQLNEYLIKTHGKTHKEYSLELIELYDVKKEKELENFEDVGNKMLLWHGSRTTNYGGILSQGLRIAPAEAPVSGHMFGKGVYFSDMSSKSANYIYPSRSKNEGFLLLCEVSLGNCKELLKANERASKLQKNINSVKGCGMIEPDSSTWITVPDGVVVPVGEPRDTDVSKNNKGYLLNYNEYIVYNRNQIKIRYLLKVRFNYK